MGARRKFQGRFLLQAGLILPNLHVDLCPLFFLLQQSAVIYKHLYALGVWAKGW
jgi:hypothetical protein